MVHVFLIMCALLKMKGMNFYMSNLPVKSNGNLPAKIKSSIKKSAKILGYSAGVLALAGVAVFAPVLAIPSVLCMGYGVQKIFNSTVYKSYPDLALLARHSGKNIKIVQDAFRPDLLKHLLKLPNREKAGFMQLQTLVGLSKMPYLDENGVPFSFETDSHGVIRKSLMNLQKLGYIQNYQESFLKNSHLIAPKLAVGNFKGIKDTVEMYHINFDKTDKPIDFYDKNLQKYFPLVFSKKSGLLAKNNFDLIKNDDGSFSVDYNSEHSFIQPESSVKNSDFLTELKENTPSYEKQSEISKDFINKSNDIQKFVDEKDR